MNELTIHGWIARDESGQLWLYLDDKPKKGRDSWTTTGWKFGEVYGGRDIFPAVKWEDDEPTEVRLTLELKGGEE